MTSVTTCLWFADAAEEAARTYCAIVPDSRILQVMQRDDGRGVLFVSFELAGRPHLALNGNPGPHFNGAVSLAVMCDTQAEVDRIWDALLEGGKPIANLVGIGGFGRGEEIRPIVLDRRKRVPQVLVAEAAVASQRRFDGLLDRDIECLERPGAVAGARAPTSDLRLGSAGLLTPKRELRARTGRPTRRGRALLLRARVVGKEQTRSDETPRQNEADTCTTHARQRTSPSRAPTNSIGAERDSHEANR